MLEATSGHTGPAASATLPPEHRAQGVFLPCYAEGVDRVEARRPDLSPCVEEALVAEATWDTSDMLRPPLEPMRDLARPPGQSIGLLTPAGALDSAEGLRRAADICSDDKPGFSAVEGERRSGPAAGPDAMFMPRKA